MPTPIDLDDYRADLERIRDARQAWLDSSDALADAQRAPLLAQQLDAALEAAQRAHQVYAGHCTTLAMVLLIEAGVPLSDGIEPTACA